MLDSLKGSSHAGTKFLLDKNSGKFAQLEISREVVPAIARGTNGFDRTQTPQERQPLARRTQADVQPVCDIVHGEGLRGNKQKAIDLADRFL